MHQVRFSHLIYAAIEIEKGILWIASPEWKGFLLASSGLFCGFWNCNAKSLNKYYALGLIILRFIICIFNVLKFIADRAHN